MLSQAACAKPGARSDTFAGAGAFSAHLFQLEISAWLAESGKFFMNLSLVLFKPNLLG
jgi:hypothetical protein